VTDAGHRECGVCWWVYDPAQGDDDAQVPPGVAFEDLPDGYTCPRCQAPRERFLRPTADPVEKLVGAYRVIEARMRGLPIHNPRLVVEAVGFRSVGDLVVGVLVTPWFVNLVVLGPPLPREGDTVEITLPGGRFAALGASPEGAAHLAVSLLSPVNELADRGAARAMAEEVLRLVLTPEGGASANANANATERAPVDAPEPAAPAGPRAIGRRGLLGALLVR
jgi:[NiFe] hydrogenase assembly HybE family chaperone